MLEGKNTGFVIATPIGLVIASVLCAVSSFVDANAGLSPAVMRRQRVLRGLVLAAIAIWTAYSLSGLPPLDQQLAAEGAMLPLMVLTGLGVLPYAVAAARYYSVWKQRRRPLPASVIIAFTLLTEAMIAIALACNWHASWWECTCSCPWRSGSSPTRREDSDARSGSAVSTSRGDALSLAALNFAPRLRSPV